MNILFLTDSYKKNHEILIRSIIRCLQHAGHDTDMEIQSGKDYDCIVLFNKKKTRLIRKCLSFRQIPVIFAFCVSDTAHEYTIDLDRFDHTLIFEDKISSVPLHPFNNKSFMHMMYCLHDKDDSAPAKETTDRPAIYVGIDKDYFGDTVFLKILPLLNQLSQYDFYCCGIHKNHRPLLNKNIKMLDDKHDPAVYIRKSEMVIGSGYPVITALLENKKAIVVGEKGFGGIVNRENLGHHFGNFFQGRNGGKYDEYIPLDLLKRSIEDTNTPFLSEDMRKYLDAGNSGFIDILQQVVESGRMIGNNLKNTPLILKKEYLLMRHDKSFRIVNHLLGTFHKRINESECAILSRFNRGCTPQTVLDEYPEYEPEVMEFIDELVAMKILTRFYGNENTINKSRHIIE